MSLKRVDALLSNLGYTTRSQTKEFLTHSELLYNNEKITSSSQKISHAHTTLDGEKLDPLSLTILMHKPKGFICSHSDAGRLIYELLPSRWQRRNPKLSTVGRLDSDTTGAIIITDDGLLIHRLSSPKTLTPKIYLVTLADPLRGNEATIFASGDLLLRGEKAPLLPAKLSVLGTHTAELEIVEGRYHQVKRMFAALGNRVVALHRQSFGAYSVADLKVGEFKLI